MCHSHLEIEFGNFVTFINGRNGSGKSAVCLALQLLMDKSSGFMMDRKRYRTVKKRDAAPGSRCYIEMVISNKKTNLGGCEIPSIRFAVKSDWPSGEPLVPSPCYASLLSPRSYYPA